MAVARENVLSTSHAETFLRGAVALSQLSTGITPTQLNQSRTVQEAPRARLFGTEAELARPLSWWDLFTWWHVTAMNWPGSNRAHRGPVFLPWHRLFLRRLEEAIQTVSGDPGFGLPYWDWAADGALSGSDQLQAPIWSLLGPPSGTIDKGTAGELRVRLYNSSQDGRIYVGAPRPIWRTAKSTFGLPTPAEEAATLKDDRYDNPPWNEDSLRFRNKAEGWTDPLERPTASQGPQMHNRVHVWVGGEMAPGSSPNDPVFWLNHCNIDRIWEGWMAKHGRQYQPGAGEGPPGQRLDDQLFSIVWPTMTPKQLLDPGSAGLDWFEYDELPV
ncbi:MAG TPA: tyrosinase family protein [Solirubrobacterales bacterium]|jgi:tyrosinase|nr:tyrosinase family protein [Solirubrobacterales bacterium]